jgi:hypothetical protein
MYIYNTASIISINPIHIAMAKKIKMDLKIRWIAQWYNHILSHNLKVKTYCLKSDKTAMSVNYFN